MAYLKASRRTLLIISVLINLSLLPYVAYKVYDKLNKKPRSLVVNNKWNGFDIVEFEFHGFPAKVVMPSNPTHERHWIWRTQFWDEQPQADIALLKKGYFLAYVDVQDLYGSKVSLERLSEFYSFVTSNFDLNKKVVLEGFSRGGLDAYNWASRNTDKVSCIYADAPVCDLKSWPAGMGTGQGSSKDLKKCLRVYGLDESKELESFTDMPLHNCIKIAQAGIPVLHVCGDNDDVVPIEENTYKLKDAFEKAGGKMVLIVKKGGGHHPHSLPDPTPIVEFITNHHSQVDPNTLSYN